MRIFIPLLLVVCVVTGGQLNAQANDELVTQAVLKFEAGEYAASAADMEQALADPSTLSPQRLAQAHLYRGRLYLRQQMETQPVDGSDPLADAPLMAFEEYKKALEADDGTVKSVINLQLNQLFPQLFNGAAAAYNESRAAQSEEGKIALLDKADKYARAAYEIKPNDYRTSDLCGRILYSSEQYDEALRFYLTARRQYPRARATEPNFGAITNIYRSATIILRDKIERANPDRALESTKSGQDLLELEYARWKNNFGTTDTRKEQQYLDGRKSLVREEVTTYLTMNGRVNETIAAFEHAVNGDFKDDDQMHIVYAQYIEVDDWEKAVALLKRATEIDPSNFVAYNKQAVIYFNEAVELYNLPSAQRTEDQNSTLATYLQKTKSLSETVYAMDPRNVQAVDLLKRVADLTDDEEGSAKYEAILQQLQGN